MICKHEFITERSQIGCKDFPTGIPFEITSLESDYSLTITDRKICDKFEVDQAELDYYGLELKDFE